MIKKLIIIIIAIAAFATIAYQKGWLSDEGKKVYDDSKQKIIEQTKKAVKKGADAGKELTK